MPLDDQIFGQGIYTPRQAARLIGSTPQEILRWTRGSGPTVPLWSAHYQSIDDTTEISFSDLIEVRVVRAFRRAGISLQAIRFAIRYAQQKFGTEHPLTSIGFKTDGQEILMEALEQDGELVSLSPKSPGQKVFKSIVEQSLNDLEYEAGAAVLWRPQKAKSVVIDPKRSFGSPILEEAGISTRLLYEEFELFKNVGYLSKIYEIPRSLVSDAISYEVWLDATSDSSHGKSII